MKKFNPMLIIPHVKELWNGRADLQEVLDEANTATDNANNSADLATSAATNANNAAAFANSQRGWTPIHEFEADGAQRQVKKLVDYIGGTGNKPTTNIGQYVIDGGYTADKSLATNFKGEQGGQVSEVDLMINTTHADLLSLVNNSGLTPGQQYRITDYVATVNTDLYTPDSELFYARSNNHAFDIIVTADSTNKLNENARAIRHEGDTYFPLHTKFEAWKLKYTIFNDSERFTWAVSEGKGVIYQLIDEWNNDIPYDFKSIQFQRDDVWVYTFGGIADDSLQGNCYSNTINEALMEGMYLLNNNTFGNNCIMNTLGDFCIMNTFGNECYSNTFGVDCHSNTFENGCQSNTLGVSCYSNTFGVNCYSNTFENGCYSNTFGYDCNSNTFEHDCVLNTFGNYCQSNTFGNYCQSNTFGNYCQSNTFGYDCNSNTFGNEYILFNIGSIISNKDFTTLLPLFTTPPNMNEIKVTKSVNGAVMSQVINATTTESVDI